MIPKQQQFYGKPFVTERGVKQGDVVSPTIFNIIIDAVVRQTLYDIMADNNNNTTTIQFYADDGVLAGDDYKQIQQMLEILQKNFLLFGLEISIEKTEMMTMHAKPKHKPMSVEAYDTKISGIGLSYKQKQTMMTTCEWCNKQVQVRSLQRHHLSATCINIRKQKLKNNDNNILQQIQQIEEQIQEPETQTFEIDMPMKVWTKCPHVNCLYTTNDRNKMRRHFRSIHLQDIIIIKEEGLLPQCLQCGIFQNNVNSDKHLQSEDCKRYTEIKNNKRLDICNKASVNVKFQLDGNNIKAVNEFKYLGRIIDNDDNDMKAIQKQITKARAVWGKIGKILKMRSDSNIRIMSIFYKVIIQTVLLYGSESWVINDNSKSKLRSFHNRCARFLTGRYITQKDEQWVYPETKRTLELAHLLPIEDYIIKRKTKIEEYARETAIYDECIKKSLYIKSNNSLQWWPKTNISIDNNNIIINNNNNNKQQYDNYDPNEIELEWLTEVDEVTNNVEDNELANNEGGIK